MKYNQLRYLFFLILPLLQIASFAQGVCDLTNGIEKGGFTYDTPSAGCHPLNVRIKDNSGGTEVKYIFDYQGESASQLASLSPSTSLSNTFSNFTDKPISYVILQYGKKNGNPMYYCNIVTVRPDNEPVFTTSACNGSVLKLIIPQDPANDFDSYKITWGSPFSDQIVAKTALPFSDTKNYPFAVTRPLKVEGIYNTNTNNCAAPNARLIPMNSGGNYPTITKLELSSDNKDATLTFTGAAEKNYSIYQRGINASNYDLSQPFRQNVGPGTHKVSVIDANRSCFIIYRDTGCAEMSGEVCTIRLDSIVPNGKVNPLIWNPHPNNKISLIGSIGTGITNTVVSIKKEEVNTKTKNSISATSVQSTYNDAVDCSKDFCYQIEVKTTNNSVANVITNSISLSPKRCISRKDIILPAITNTLVSVNAGNKAEITYTDNSPWTLLRKRYVLYHNDGTKYVRIDSTTNLTLNKFADNAVDASQKSECYKIVFVDECDSRSDFSPEFCTINLSENSGGQLQWTNKTPFGNAPISTFEIQSYDETTNTPSTETTKPSTETTYDPDLDKFEEEAKYRIKIVAGGKESYSNIYTIPIKAKIFIPEAFSPDGDALNSELQIFGTLKRITDFNFHIYNRWGNPVFSSNDPKIFWDGTFQGKESPVDTYSYTLYAKLKDGQEIKKIGKFVLLR